VATKEHAQFASCMDMIDLMPPGLYEAVIADVGPDVENASLIDGRYLFRLEARTLDDIRAFGGNDEADERRFATAARLSDINLGLYRAFAQPFVRGATNAQSAELARELHPNRLRFAMFSDRNPLMSGVKDMAQAARASRRPVSPDNPLLAMEQVASTWISTWLEGYRLARDTMTEALFVTAYGAPWLQAMVGLGAGIALPNRHIERDLAREATASRARAELEGLYESGGAVQATVRALIYIRLPEGSADERGFAMMEAIRAMQPPSERLHLLDLKKTVHDQYLVVRLDEERAIRALPRLLPDKVEDRQAALDVLQSVLSARGGLSEEEERRLQRVKGLFNLGPRLPFPREQAVA